MEGNALTREQLDSYCRALAAIVEMVEGNCGVTLEFPLMVEETLTEFQLRAFRCVDCDDIHVQLEIHKPPALFDWNKERSDNLWFGPEEETSDDSS